MFKIVVYYLKDREVIKVYDLISGFGLLFIIIGYEFKKYNNGDSFVSYYV